MQIGWKEAVTELKTLRDMIRFVVSNFYEANLCYGHGTDNAWDEAISLVLHTLHLPHDVDQRVMEANLLQQERASIIDLMKRRITERIPLPYLTHEAWFAGIPFYVNEHVLIPRSPIAELIEQHFSPWIQEEKVHHILDLCTGSGCIAIASAIAFPDATVDAIDISMEALEVAKINVQKHKLDDQVHLIASDLFDAIPDKKYDVIVSNPPYVGESEFNELPKEYTHEPKIGLLASQKGLSVVVRILEEASKHLTPHGILIVEVGNSEGNLIECYPNIPFTWLEFQRGGGGIFLLTAKQLISL